MLRDDTFAREFGVIPLNVLEPTHELRRAYDLFVPAEKQSDIEYFWMDDTNPKEFAGKIERAKFTGCVKISNANSKIRGALLIFAGRVVGAIRTDIVDKMTTTTDQSLEMLGLDLHRKNTAIMIYKQSESIILPFASLFLGHPVERSDDYSAREYYEYIVNWFSEQGGTSTLALSQEKRTALVFINKGKHAGFFDVDDVNFDAGESRLQKFLDRMPAANLEASILPPEFLDTPNTVGFELSSYVS